MLEIDIPIATEQKVGEASFLNDTEFLQKFRLSKDSFDAIVEMIKDHPVFAMKRRGPRQCHRAHQLAVLLKYMGTEGSGASNSDLRNIFKISRGSAQVYRERALTAIRSLSHLAYTWPDDEERKKIASVFEKKHGWPNCVGVMDGTLFPLATKPQTEDFPDYKGRKHTYSITCLVVCDHERLIRYFLCGWPGSAHDERVFRNSALFKEAHERFSENQYIISDAAYESFWFNASIYRKPAGGNLPREHTP